MSLSSHDCLFMSKSWFHRCFINFVIGRILLSFFTYTHSQQEDNYRGTATTSRRDKNALHVDLENGVGGLTDWLIYDAIRPVYDLAGRAFHTRLNMQTQHLLLNNPCVDDGTPTVSLSKTCCDWKHLVNTSVGAPFYSCSRRDFGVTRKTRLAGQATTTMQCGTKKCTHFPYNHHRRLQGGNISKTIRFDFGV